MDDINQMPFNFDPRIGMIVGVMVGFLVFAVSLDLTWEKLLRVLKRPKAPAIGLVAQFGILPATAFLVGLYLTEAPSIALGLLLVTCCPGGALSNYLTGVAKGDVATSISMTAVSTLFSIILTPFFIRSLGIHELFHACCTSEYKHGSATGDHDPDDHVGYPRYCRNASAC